MSKPEKATLQRITCDGQPRKGDVPIVVQFNPTTLKLALSAQNEGGKTVGNQVTQYLGTSSAVLTLELHFDTADEGTTDHAVSVLDRTKPIEQFLLPQGQSEDNQQPPKVRFQWGSFVLDGVVDSMNVDIDLFSQGGVPLRAKVGLSIREQNSDFEFLKKGAGANAGNNAIPPGGVGPGGVGGVGLGVNASFGVSAGIGASAGIGVGASFSAGVNVGAHAELSIGGESAAEFAARVGVDPTAWRGIAAGQIDSTLSLPVGAEIGFNANLSAGAGVGSAAGIEAKVTPSIEASFGLSSDGARREAAAASLTAPGFALSAAGGVAAALETVDIVRTQAAAAEARRAFAAPPAPPAAAGTAVASIPEATAAAALAPVAGPAAPPRPARPDQVRTPLALTGAPSPAMQAAAATAPPRPRADPRTTSFGFGVPLRPRAGGAIDQRSSWLSGSLPLRPRRSDPFTAIDPTTPPWVALPPRAVSASASAAFKSCGCTCACGCSGKGSAR